MSQWEGEERRQGPDPTSLQHELRAVRQDVGRLASAVATLGSDERMQRVIDSVVEEEKRHRQRLLTKVIIGLVVIGVIGIFQLILTGDVKDTAAQARSAARSAAAVSRYVNDCLVHPAGAIPGECGNTAATGQQSSAVVALFCFLELPQAERTPPNADGCFQKAAAQTKATTATTRP